MSQSSDEEKLIDIEPVYERKTSMKVTRQIRHRALLLVAAIVALGLASSQIRADTGSCSGASITLPFTDVPSSNIFFCSIASVYFSGLTNGTTATTYSPSANVTREQMAAFITRTLDQSLRRGSSRAPLGQWWTQTIIPSTAMTQVGNFPLSVQSDGADLWVANFNSNTVSRVRASDGRLLGTWTGATGANVVLVARGRIFVTGFASPNPGQLYSIDPTQPPGAVLLLSNELGGSPLGIAYDGSKIWTTNDTGSVSIFRFICVGSCVTTLTAGFSGPIGILYDGANIWVTDAGDNTLKKLNSDGSIAQSVPVGNNPRHPIFDGTNIWVPNAGSDSMTVVRVKDSAGNPLAQPFVLATLVGNSLNFPLRAAFDGQRILATNVSGDSVSLWKATDLTPLGSFQTGSNSSPSGACSDGINFWITLTGTNHLARF
jgi:S-layer family protein